LPAVSKLTAGIFMRARFFRADIPHYSAGFKCKSKAPEYLGRNCRCDRDRRLDKVVPKPADSAIPDQSSQIYRTSISCAARAQLLHFMDQVSLGTQPMNERFLPQCEAANTSIWLFATCNDGAVKSRRCTDGDEVHAGLKIFVTLTSTQFDHALRLTNATDPQRHFRTDHLHVDLRARSIRGGAVTLAAQAGKFAIQLLSTMVLARLLTPADFGLVAMVTVITGFVGLFKDLGLSQATVQRSHITHAQVSTLFWINVIISALLMIIITAIAPAIAWIYREPRLMWITIALAGTFIFSGLAVQHQALLRRQMKFLSLVIVDLLSVLVGITIALLMAWHGSHYWALVMQTIAQTISYCVLIWLWCDWKPTRLRKGSGVREMLGFGGDLTGFQVVNYFARNADNAMIGWRWGDRVLGLYGRAYQLLLLPLAQINNPMSGVAIPALSRLQNHPKQYRAAFIQLLEKLTLITMPAIALTIVCADWIVRLVLGAQWAEAAKIFVWLGLAALFQPLTYTTGWLFVSQGRTREQLLWGIIGSSMIVLSFVIGLRWGAIGVAIAYSLCMNFLATPVLLWMVGRRGPVSTGDLYRIAAFPTIAAVAVSAILLGYRASGGTHVLSLDLAICFALTILGTFFCYAAFAKGRDILRDSRQLFREVFAVN
jgi:O-antigen/teichoic acid export membrane protein